MHWVRWDLLLYRKVQCGPQFVWSPGDRSLFFWGFFGSSCWKIGSCWSTAALGSNCGLLLRTGVQLVIFCTAIEAQVIFKMLLALVTGQLAIAGQLGREVHLWSIGLLFESRGWRWLGGRVLGRWCYQRWICLVLRSCGSTGGRSFSLLLGVRLKGLFLYLSCMVVFAVLFPVVVINSHC